LTLLPVTEKLMQRETICLMKQMAAFIIYR